MVDKTAQASWNEWAKERPDPLESVQRGPDLEQSRRVAEDVARKLQLGPSDVLLDVGCGSGLFDSLLRELTGARVVGADFAHAQCALGRRHFPDMGFVAAAAEHLPFADGQFSRILCYGTWMYVESQEETLRGFLRVLRRPGIILLGDLPDRRLRHWLYLEYLKRLPGHLMRPWSWLRKAHDARHQATWQWVDIETTVACAEALGCRVEVLTQPPGRQYGITTYIYRRDVRLWVD